MNGQGDGSIGFRVTANDDPAERATAIGVQDQRVQVSQAGRPCSFELSSVQEAVDATGGERTVQVTASSAMCRWTAVSDAPWIAVASARDGSGSSTIVLKIEPLAGPPRIGSVTIAGHVLRVEQGQTAGPSPGPGPGPGPGPNCTYSVDPVTYASPAAGAATAFNIRTAANCAWTASSSTSWIAIAAGHAGNGPGEVRIAIAANTGPSRSASFDVAGQIITVSQASGCSVSVTPSTVNVAASVSAGTVQVAAGSGCIWSATTATAWIGIPEGSGGTGTGQLRFSVAANTGPARDGAISIGGHVVRVSQASGCTYSISPTSQDVAATAGSGTVSVATAAGCPWSAASSTDWIAVASNTGTGPAQLGFSVVANLGPARTGTFTFAGHTFTIRQASPCSWSFVPPYHQFDANGGNGAILVLVTGPCTWTASTEAGWITITSGASGTGPGLVQFVASPNPGAARTATLTIGGERYEVVQTAR